MSKRIARENHTRRRNGAVEISKRVFMAGPIFALFSEHCVEY